MKKFYFVIIFISNSVLANTWSFTKQIDPFNDQVIYLAKVQGDIEHSSVTVICGSDKKLDIILSTGGYIGFKNRYRTVLRVDKNEPISGVWFVSTDGASVFSPKDNIAMLSKEFMKGGNLVAQTTDYKGSNTIARFSLTKASKSIQSVIEACPLDEIGSAEKGINKDIISHLKRYGPESTKCHKKILSHLGYEVASRDANKNREYYQAIQKFIDDRTTPECHSQAKKPQVECRSDNYFIHSLYVEALKSNQNFKATCGKLIMAD